MTPQEALKQWKHTHPGAVRPVQGDMFGGGAVGDKFALQAECYRAPETIAEQAASDKRAHELDMKQGRLF